MIDPDVREQQALNRAGALGNEYLLTLPNSDLKRMSADEWLQLVNCIVGGYFDALAEQDAARRRR